jgi:hypothetical protein
MLTDERLNGEGPGDVPPSRRELYGAIRLKIGQGLKVRYEPLWDLPPALQALVSRLDAR